MRFKMKEGENKVNPFLASMRINIIEHQETIQDTQQAEQTTVIRTYEAQRYCRYYRVPHADNVLFSECTSLGRDLYLYILNHLPDNIDFIALKSPKVMKEMRIKSMKTFYRSINNLIDVGIINRKTASQYWINPLFIFKGDRLKFFSTHKPDAITVVRTNFNDRLLSKSTPNNLPKTVHNL